MAWSVERFSTRSGKLFRLKVLSFQPEKETSWIQNAVVIIKVKCAVSLAPNIKQGRTENKLCTLHSLQANTCRNCAGIDCYKCQTPSSRLLVSCVYNHLGFYIRLFHLFYFLMFNDDGPVRMAHFEPFSKWLPVSEQDLNICLYMFHVLRCMQFRVFLFKKAN